MPDRPKHHELEQVVAALTEGVLLVEPDQRIGFANAAALAMHGVGSIAELGATVDAYRANFALRYRNHHPLKPQEYPLERVLAGEAFDEVVVQVEARREPGREWVHRIRSLVITDAKGRPDCLVLVIADVSDRFEAEDRFERAFAANPAPAAICRLADQRFVKLNEGFLEMTGYRRDEVLDRTLTEVDVLERAERRELALERLGAGRSIPQMEACLTVPSDGDRLVVVAGQPIEVDDDACMLFTFVDLESRRQAQRALRESEERLATLFRLAPVPLMVCRRAGGVVLDVNEAFCAVTGYRTKDAVGRGLDEVGLWAEPEARDRFERELEKAGGVRGVEGRLRGRDGETLDALVSAELAALGGEACALYAFQDISSRKRSEAELMRAIEAVMSDATWFSQAVVEKLAALRAPARPGKARAAAVAALSPRERDVIERMCRGLDDPAIAAELGVSPNTVRNHVTSIFRKIGVNRRSAAVVWARDRGFGDGTAPGRHPRRRAG